MQIWKANTHNGTQTMANNGMQTKRDDDRQYIGSIKQKIIQCAVILLSWQIIRITIYILIFTLLERTLLSVRSSCACNIAFDFVCLIFFSFHFSLFWSDVWRLTLSQFTVRVDVFKLMQMVWTNSVTVHKMWSTKATSRTYTKRFISSTVVCIVYLKLECLSSFTLRLFIHLFIYIWHCLWEFVYFFLIGHHFGLALAEQKTNFGFGRSMWCVTIGIFLIRKISNFILAEFFFLLPDVRRCAGTDEGEIVCESKYGGESGTHPRSVTWWSRRFDQSSASITSTNAVVWRTSISWGCGRRWSSGSIRASLSCGWVADGHFGRCIAAQCIPARIVFLSVSRQ